MQRSTIQLVASAILLLSSATTGLAQMQVGTNLDGIADYTAEKFVNVMDQQRDWVTRNADGTGDWSTGVANEMSYSSNGWPTEIPQTVAGASEPQMVHTLMPVRGAGIYRLTVEGTGTIVFIAGDGLLDPSTPFGRSVTIAATGGSQTFDIEIHDSEHGDGTGTLFLELPVSDSSDPVRNMNLIMPGHHNNWQSQPFYPGYLQHLGFSSNLRFMDWGSTNSNQSVSWSNRATLDSHTQASARGASVEYMVQLANQTQQDAWFTIPAEANDDYVMNMANYIRDNLNSDLKVFVEYSNETWNYIFDQTFYVQEQGVLLGLDTDAWRAGQKFTAWRSARIWKIFEDQFANDAANRLVKVMATQAGNAYLTQVRMDALLDPAINPQNVRADALAIAPYFGGIADQIVNDGQVDSITIPEILARAQAHLQGACTDWVVQHKAIADQQNLWLISYEGGQHLVGSFENQNNQTLTDKLIAANRDPIMGDLYDEYLDMLNDNGVVLHSNFSYLTEPGKYGSWGVIENHDQPIAQAHKYQAIVDWIAGNPPQNIAPIVRLGQDFSVIDDGDGIETLQLDGSASRDLDGHITTWSWSINGNAASSTPMFSTSLPLGQHAIELTVTDNQGTSTTDSITVVIAPQTSGLVLVESDFSGTSPGQNTPWTSTSQLSGNTIYSGWNRGAGLTGEPNDNQFGFVGTFDATVGNLDDAIAGNDYLSVTVSPQSGHELDLRGAAFEFSIERIGWHAPRQYVVLSSVNGFDSANVLYQSPWIDDVSPIVTDLSFSLPFDGFRIDQPIEFRIYTVGGQYGGHPASLNSFQLYGSAVEAAEVSAPFAQKMLDGSITGGDLGDLAASDDSHLMIDPSPTTNPFKQKIDIILLAEIDVTNPSDVSLVIEAAMDGGPVGDVLQSIRAYDYSSNAWIEVDSRAADTNDISIDLDFPGDPTNFVHHITGEVLVRLVWNSEEFSGTPFTWSVDIDEVTLRVLE